MSNILPHGYTQLEYLQSSGTQYLNLNFIPTTTTNIELDFSSQESALTKGFFGEYKQSGYCFEAQSSGSTGSNAAIFYSSNSPEEGILFANSKSFDRCVLKTENNKLYKNDIELGSFTVSSTTTLPFLLFTLRVGSNVSYYSKMTAYGCKIHDNGVLIRNLIPAQRNSDSVLGMYDLVTDTFFTNAGTGEFIAGPVVYNGYKLSNFTYFKESTLPAGYLQLEYIESTGTQYIDTGNTCNTSTDEITCEYQYDSTEVNRWVFGAFRDTDAQSNSRVIGLARSNSNPNTTRVFYNEVYNDVDVRYVDFNKHTVKFDASGVSIDGTNVKPFVSFATTLSLYLFKSVGYGITDEHAFKGKIYSYKQTRSGSDIINLIPAKRYSDGVLGMYDLVSNTFLTNAGTGTFIAGPVVYHDSKLTHYQIYNPRVSGYTELEYLESTGTQYIDTGYVPNDTSGFEIVGASLSEQNCVWIGSREDSGNTRWSFGTIMEYYSLHYGWNYVNMIDNSGITIDNKATLSVNYNNTRKFIFNSIEQNITGTLLPSPHTQSAYLFTWNMSGSPSSELALPMKLYSCKITEGTNLIQNLIPAKRNSDSILGMYDLANSGKNHWDPSLPYVSGYLKADGVVDTNVSKPYYCIDYIEVKPNTKYTYSVTLTAAGAGDGIRICFYDENKNFVGTREGGETTSPTRYHYPITSPANAKYVRISHVATFEAAQLEEGQLETAYEPFPFYTNKGTGTFIAGPIVQRTNITNPIIYI